MKKTIRLLSACALIIAITGCGGGQEASQAPALSANPNAPQAAAPAAQAAPASHEPVTLTMGYRTDNEASIGPVIELLKKKAPYITIEKVVGSNSVEDMLKQGYKPDLLQLSYDTLQELTGTGMAMDLTPYFKKFNFDMNTFTDGYLDNLRSFFVDPSQLIAVQYAVNTGVLYYNKDIFDKFGVNYPTDNMTWEQVMALAKNVTRMTDGVQYHGIEARGGSRLRYFKSQLGLSYVDPKTGMAAMDTDLWKYFMSTVLAGALIPGNEKSVGADGFSKSKIVAMMPNRTSAMKGIMTSGVNFDIAAYPTFAKAPGIGTSYGGAMFTVTSASKHKDEAFQFILAALSKEGQTEIAENGDMPVIKGVEASYAKNVPGASKLHLEAIFKLKPGTNPYPSLNNADGDKLLGKAFDEAAAGKDLNTVMRETNEQLNQLIKETK